MVLVIDVVRILSAYGANVWEHIVFIFPRELLQKGLPVLNVYMALNLRMWAEL